MVAGKFQSNVLQWHKVGSSALRFAE
jgi:hypothetical protein